MKGKKLNKVETLSGNMALGVSGFRNSNLNNITYNAA